MGIESEGRFEWHRTTGNRRHLGRGRTLVEALLSILLFLYGSAGLAQPPAVPSSEAPSLAANFRLGAGDVISIDVFGLDDLDRKVRILSNGTISLPLLGTFSIADLTLSQAEQRIEQMLSDKQLVKEPDVSIFIEDFVSRSVSVQGAVVRPGVYQLIGEKSLLDILGEAGGISQLSGGMIFILRKDTEGGKRWIEIEAERLTDQGDMSLNIALQPADVVMVPHAKQFRVYVTGAVERPGPVEFSSSDGISVLQAITASGGPAARANLSKVHIIRRLAGGSQEKINVNIKRIRKGRDEDVLLLKNDTVVVGEGFL